MCVCVYIYINLTSLKDQHEVYVLTANLVHILQGKTQRLVGGAGWGQNGVKSLKQGLASGVALLALHIPALKPGHLITGLQHVVAVPARDGHKSDSLGVVANLLDIRGHLFFNFPEASLKKKYEVCITTKKKLMITKS